MALLFSIFLCLAHANEAASSKAEGKLDLLINNMPATSQGHLAIRQKMIFSARDYNCTPDIRTKGSKPVLCHICVSPFKTKGYVDKNGVPFEPEVIAPPFGKKDKEKFKIIKRTQKVSFTFPDPVFDPERQDQRTYALACEWTANEMTTSELFKELSTVGIDMALTQPEEKVQTVEDTSGSEKGRR